MKKLRERLQPLTLKGKIEYLIEYYSFHMIAAVVILFFLILGINTFSNQHKEILSVRVVGANTNAEQTIKLQKELEKYVVNTKKNESMSVHAINTSEVSSNPDSLAKIQKLAAEIAAKEVDVLLVDEETFHQFNEEENLYDLSSLNELIEWKEKKYPSQNDPNKITGIDVSEISSFSTIVETNNPLVLAILTNTERIDEVKKFVHNLK
ncbi:hypothetical protein MLOOGBEN_08480 [Bacillus sp. EB106-08-02-XG196]|nr:hypothetical protein [Bacillus sp. EB106-08-02-XG196]